MTTSVDRYLLKPIYILPERGGPGISGEAIIVRVWSEENLQNRVSIDYYYLKANGMITLEADIVNPSSLISNIQVKKKFSKAWKVAMIKNLFEKPSDKYTMDNTKMFIEDILEHIEDEPDFKKYFKGKK